MRMVVDSNYLRTKELRDWLAASPKNIAVLTDQGVRLSDFAIFAAGVC
jgi:hypothetical protein